MPLSPHTPPGTHIVVTWAPTDVEEYVHGVILPQYRVRCADLLRRSIAYKASLRIGQRFVLAEIVPCPIANSGYLCKLQGQPTENGFALEHFDVAQLPKAITDSLDARPVDKETEALVGAHRW